MGFAPHFARAACVAACAVVIGDAQAEWRLNGEFSETVEVVTNRDLDGDDDPAFGSTTRLSAIVGVVDPTANLAVTFGVLAAEFVGPGAQEDFDRIDPFLSWSGSYRQPRTEYTMGGSVDVQPTSVAQIEDTGVTDEDSTQVSANANFGVAYRVDPRNRANVGLNVAVIDFLESSSQFTPTQRFGATAGWEHTVNSRLSGDLGLSLSHLIAEDDEDTRTTSASITGGFTQAVHPRLSINANLGPSATLRRRSTEDDDLTFGATGAFGADWQATETTGLNLNLSQGLETSSDGTLRNVSRMNFGMGHTFSERFTGNLQFNYFRQSGDASGFTFDAARELFNASPSVSYQLDRTWRASAGYTFTLDRDEQQDDMSNRVFLTVSAGF